jgi:O-antigen ligase
LLIGWKIEEGAIMAEQKRARGFYSHPLTFAYAFLALLPVAVHHLRLRLQSGARGHWQAWAILALVLWLVASSLSRVAIVVGFGYVALSAASFGLNATQKKIGFGVALAILVGLAVFPNPIRERMQQSFAGSGEDKHTHYSDDRLAFWDAHWLMVKERPWTGHGVKLDGAYRAPYYEKLGLGDFEKQYEAHNQWLQTLAETGIIGLVLFVLWHVSWIVNLARRSGLAWWRHPGAQSLLLIGVGGMTQNAFQDAEVRFTLTCILAFIPLIVGNARGNPKSSRALH